MANPVVVIYVSSDPEKVRTAFSLCSSLILIDNKLPHFPRIPDGVQVLGVSRQNSESLISCINRALSYVDTSWVFIASDQTLDNLRHLDYLLKTAQTIPRLASLSPSSSLGLNSVSYNPIFGTLYPSYLFKGIGFFDSSIQDFSRVALEWAANIQVKGFLHMKTYCDQDLKSPPAVSPGEVAEGVLDIFDYDRFLIPQNEEYEGILLKKPWYYKVSVVIPHYGKNVRVLNTAVNLWREQKNPPYIMVYDTGTPSCHHKDLLALASEDTEIHFARYHGFYSYREIIALAYERGLMDCRTEKIIFTHNDVLLNSPEVVNELSLLCNDTNPVVGYRSPVDLHSIKNVVGTQLVMAYMPVLDQIRASWNLRRNPCYASEISTRFNYSLSYAGVDPVIIGKESRLLNHRTTHFEHIGGVSYHEVYLDYMKNHLKIAIDSAISTALHSADVRILDWKKM